MTDLLPCPFCGETRIYMGDWGINCPGCLAGIPDENLGKEELIACWNSRVQQSADSGWKDIKDAPRDGTLVLTYKKTWSFNRVVLWRNGKFFDASGMQPVSPTHFRLLPAPPAEGEA